MTKYTPSLDDVQRLLDRSPQYFTSPLQTQRAVNAARNSPLSIRQLTAEGQYRQYLANGGSALGSSGQAPTNAATLDQRFGSASCDCAAASPCCMKALSIGCDHRANRMTLPPTDPAKRKILVVVTDQGGASGHDTLTFTPKMQKRPNCSMPGKIPLLRVTGKNDAFNDLPMSGPQKYRATYGNDLDAGRSNIEKLLYVVKELLFGETTTLERSYDVALLSCSRTGQFDCRIAVYPKVEFKVSAFYYEVTGTYFSDFTFVPAMAMGGEIEGTYSGSTFSIKGEHKQESLAQPHAKSLIPFIDGAISALQSSTKGGASGGSETRSSIEIKHRANIGAVTYKMSEHPTDHSKVGLEGEWRMGFAPFFGITAKLDLIDVVLSIAEVEAPPLAKAIKKAREYAAKGYKSKGGNIEASAHVAITFEVAGEIGNSEIVARKKVGDDHWVGEGVVGGSLGIVIRAVIKGKGKVYFVEGEAAGEASAESALKADLTAVAKTERAANGGKKFKVKVAWDGIKLKYSASVRAKAGKFVSGSAKNSGQFEVLPAATLYEQGL